MYTANLYLAFERKDGRLGHRLITSSQIQADNLNTAKAQVSRICKNNEVMVDWRAQDPTSRWSPVIEEGDRQFVRKTFRTPPADAASNLNHAFVEKVVQLPFEWIDKTGDEQS